MSRYTSQIVARAVEHFEAGWKPWKIRLLLHSEFGVMPSKDTVKAWVDPGYAAARSERHARQQREAYVAKPRLDLSDGVKEERMRAMFLRGVPMRAIGQVAAVWWGEELSGLQVRGVLGLPPDQRKVRVRRVVEACERGRHERRAAT